VTLRGSTLLGAEARDPFLLTAVLVALPFLVNDFNLQSVGSFLPYALVAASLSLVWGYCGILSLGQAAFFGLGSYGTALGVEHWGATTGLGGAVLGLAAAGFLAYIIGRIAFSARVDSFYVAVITFVVGIVMQQLLLQFSGFTGGFNGVVLSTLVLPIDTRQAYFIVLAVFAVILALLVTLVCSDAGKYIVGCRDNDRRLRFLGTDVDALRTRIFVLGAIVAATAGVLYALNNQQAVPDNVGFGFSTQILVWTAIGGRTSLTGAALGAILVNVAALNLSAGFLSYWNAILGVGFVLAVLFVPDGLYSLARRAFARFESEERVTLEVAPPGADADQERPVLRGDRLEERFGSFVALNVDRIELRPGELCALIGPNGAGKTTLVNVLSGALIPTNGTASYGQIRIDGRSADSIANLGVRRKFQAPNVFESLSVLENIRLSATRGGPAFLTAFRRSSVIRLPEWVVTLFAESGLQARQHQLAGDLSHGEKQWLELCMVLAGSPTVVLLDEPTAGLSQADRRRVGLLLRRLVEEGAAVLLIEHDFDFVREVADRTVVMHQGAVVADGTTDEVGANELVRGIYLGTLP
jgi:branched-chain amino acid transport system permease protein